MLGDDQRNTGVDQFLLRVEHVERGALAEPRFFATPLSAVSAAFT